jgi:hypothetical protein
MTSIREFAEAAGVFKMEIRNAGLARFRGKRARKGRQQCFFLRQIVQMLTLLG